MPKTAVLYYYDTVKAVISWPIPCVYYLDDFQYKMCCASARVFLLQIQTKMLGHKFHWCEHCIIMVRHDLYNYA